MTDYWVSGDVSGDLTPGGNAGNKQPQGSFDRAYIGAKQEITNFGLRFMAGDFSSQDTNSTDNYFSSFSSISSDDISMRSPDPDLFPGRRSDLTFEPVGFSDDDADVTSHANSNRGDITDPGVDRSNGAGTDFAIREPSSGGVNHLFNTNVEVSGDDNTGDPADDYAEDGDGFVDLEEENSFTFFEDDVNISDVDLGAFDDDGDEDVKVYHKGEYVNFDNTASGTSEEDDDQEPEGESGDSGENFDDEFFESVYNDRGRGVRTALIVLIVILVLGLAVFIAYQYTKGDKEEISDKVYSGVYFNGKDLGGMTFDEVQAYVTETYIEPLKQHKLTVYVGDMHTDYYLEEFFELPDANKIANEAYNYAKKGTASENKRLREELQTKQHVIPSGNFDYDQVFVNKIISQTSNMAASEPSKPKFDTDYYDRERGVYCFRVTPGKLGGKIDIDSLRTELISILNNIQNKLKNMIVSQDIYDRSITAKGEFVAFEKIPEDEIKNAIAAAQTEPSDAECVRLDKDGNTSTDLHDRITIKAEVDGRIFDAAQIAEIVSYVNTGTEVKNFYYTTVPAKVTSDVFKFNTILGRVESVNVADIFTEEEDSGVADRAKNLKNAADLFGTVELLPGQTLKLSEVIGNITTQNKFREAAENVFGTGDRVIGGGISQFATALYECAFISGLNFDAGAVKHNEFYPNYGTAGFDSYVAVSKSDRSKYTHDLAIRNIDSPIRITAKFDEKTNTLTITILGPEPGGDSAITLKSDVVSREYDEELGAMIYLIDTFKCTAIIEKQIDKEVRYVRYGEEPDPTEVPSETPEDTEDPSGSPTPDDSEDPSETPGDSEDPTETPTPDDSAQPSETPGDSESPSGSESPSDSESPSGSETPASTETESGSPGTTEETSESPGESEQVSESPEVSEEP